MSGPPSVITEVAFTDGIHQGRALVIAKQRFNFGTGEQSWSFHSDKGTGYFYGRSSLAFANLTTTSRCDPSNPGYNGISVPSRLTDVSVLDYETTNNFVFGIPESDCYTGLLVLRQSDRYGIIAPLDIDPGEPNYFGYLANAALTFDWWYGEPGVTDFSVVAQRDAAAYTHNPTPARPTIGLAGKIAFTSNLGGNGDIWVMNADGSDGSKLTYNSGHDSESSWSPDDTKIAFASERDGNQDIYVMNADGFNQVRLTSNPSEDYSPSWSPDGTKIAFTSNRDGNLEIYVMNADGSNQTSVSDSPALSEYAPSWGERS